MRIIDADALDIMGYREEFPNGAEDIGWNVAVRMINDYVQRAPTLDYKDLVPQGEWIERIEPLSWCEDDVDVFWDCSVCETSNFAPSPYCPNCGARMKGGESK